MSKALRENEYIDNVDLEGANKTIDAEKIVYEVYEKLKSTGYLGATLVNLHYACIDMIHTYSGLTADSIYEKKKISKNLEEIANDLADDEYIEEADAVQYAAELITQSLYENRLIKRHELQEDFEFYTKPNGKISVDKVIRGSSKSGKYFNDGTGFVGDTSQAIKRVPLSQMSNDDKELAQAAYSALRKNGSIDSVDQQFKTSPKADVVIKADGAHADIYYDDNVTGFPDEKNIRLVNEAKMNSFYESLLFQ